MTTLTLALLVFVTALGGQPIQPVSGRRDFQAGRSETTNLFGIYLVTQPVDGRITGYGRGDWSHLRLADSPLISADDVISYDFSDHSMRLRPEALARIPMPPVHGIPFVVVAHGQRIYLGVFITSLSSFSFAVPSIDVRPQVLNATQPRDTLVINRGYPSSSFGKGPDPRGDERIKSALMALHKVKGDR